MGMPLDTAVKDKVRAMVRRYQPCTVKELCVLTGLTPNQVRWSLTYLRKKQSVKTVNHGHSTVYCMHGYQVADGYKHVCRAGWITPESEESERPQVAGTRTWHSASTGPLVLPKWEPARIDASDAARIPSRGFA